MAVDQMKKIVTFGEIMLRLSPPAYQRLSQTASFDVTYGGAEANAAVTLANFGAPVSFISRLPENDLAAAAIGQLNLFRVKTDQIIFGGDRLGIYFLEPGAGRRNGKVIYDRQHSAMATIQSGMLDWNEIFKDAGWFHWTGITPAISASAATVIKEAVHSARRNGLIVSCDLNYRSALWKYGKSPVEVMPELIRSCDVLIADPEASEKMLGIESENHQKDFASFVKELQRTFPNLQTIATTLRHSTDAGQLLLTGMMQQRKELIQGKPHTISQVVDRVGSGDAFAGALIFGLMHFEGNDQKILDFAIASAVLKHSIPGDFNRVSVEEVFALMNGDNGGQIRR